jgi:predicted transcriptional regulator
LLAAQNPLHFDYEREGTVLQAIQRLPDDIDFRDVADEIALLAAVQEAERDIKQGRLISNEEMKSRIGQWSAR